MNQRLFVYALLNDLGSIPGRVKPKIFKMVLDTSFFNTRQYKVRIKGKVKNPGKGVALSPTPQCSSYWKGSLLVVLDYGHQHYIYIKWLYIWFVIQLYIGNIILWVRTCLLRIIISYLKPSVSKQIIIIETIILCIC